jgi:CRISPR-associated protein Csm3
MVVSMTINMKRIEGSLEVKTGLHIGGIKETVKIGGLDNPVIKIRDGKHYLPYIPGSSIKGRLRSLLEEKYMRDDESIKLIKKVFGSQPGDNEETMRGAVIFRDAYLENKESYFDENGNLIKEKLFEIKPENKIDRKSGKAEHPRFIERVVPGTKFRLEIVIVYKSDEELKKMKELLKEGFELLQDSYLGGSGTRGYGKVDVSDIINKLKS